MFLLLNHTQTQPLLLLYVHFHGDKINGHRSNIWRKIRLLLFLFFITLQYIVDCRVPVISHFSFIFYIFYIYMYLTEAGSKKDGCIDIINLAPGGDCLLLFSTSQMC